jgi:FlaA1/EpsC-like NDP-sugar epimerase
VLVTGAGGSIGSELCRQILALAPEKLVLVEHSEFALYAIHRELEKLRDRTGLGTVLSPVLCNVQNETKVMEVFRSNRPSLVYHAAAYKHVPLVERNPAEGVANNVFGTLNVARAALVVQCKAVVLISTDKAVRPTNVMGASKRLAELVLQALAGVKALRATDGAPAMRRVADMMSTQTRMVYPNRTTFSMVRFGNVLGSSGSVVPLFREQIAHGGPITLTDAKVTRYFMTIPEAVHLVLQAGAMAKGGEVFVLDMGQPVRIFDLARRMVELSGLTLRNASNPSGDIEIKVTGLRPGEKLYEELLIGDDPQRTAHPRIMMAHEKMVPWDELLPKLTELSRAANSQNIADIRDVLLELVDGFTPGELIAQPYADSGFDNHNEPTGTHH